MSTTPENANDLKWVERRSNLYQAARVASFLSTAFRIHRVDPWGVDDVECVPSRRDKAGQELSIYKEVSAVSYVFHLDREERFGHILELQGQS